MRSLTRYVVATTMLLLSAGQALAQPFTTPTYQSVTLNGSGVIYLGGWTTGGRPTCDAVAPPTGHLGSFGFNTTTGNVDVCTASGWATPGGGTVASVSVATANGLAGSSSGGTNPALTLATTITGILKGNGTAIAAATAGSDYLTPTGNGSGLTGLVYSQLPALSANTLLGALTGTTPSGQPVPACNGASSALTWTSGVGFGCNAITPGTGTVTNVDGSSTGSTLTATGGPVTGAGTLNFDVNLAHANAWTAAQTFTNNDLKLLGSSTGVTTFTSANTGASNFTLTFPAATATIATTANISTALPSIATTHLYGGSGSAGLAQDVTVGSGLSLSAGTLTASGSGGTVTNVTLATPSSTLTLGGTNPVTGSGTINADINLSHANTWAAVQTFVAPVLGAASATSVALTGGTVTNVATPSASTDAANKAYVDNIAAGLNPAVAVTAATTAILPNSPTYNNGASGIGAFITTTTTNTPLVIDGQTIALNGRVLVKNESGGGGLGAADNGVYYLSQVPALGLAWILTRALDFDQPSDINNTGAIPVVNGTVNATTSWVVTSAVAAVGTDPLTFTQYTLNPSTIVTGPSSATDGHFAIYSGSTGKLLKDTLAVPGTAATQNTGTSGATIPLLNVSNTWSAGQGVTPVALTPGTTVSVDASLSNNFTLTPAQNFTLSDPTNLKAGQVLNFWITEDGTGSRILTVGSQYQAAGGSATLILSTAANTKDLLSCVSDTTTTLTCNLTLAIAH